MSSAGAYQVPLVYRVFMTPFLWGFEVGSLHCTGRANYRVRRSLQLNKCGIMGHSLCRTRDVAFKKDCSLQDLKHHITRELASRNGTILRMVSSNLKEILHVLLLKVNISSTLHKRYRVIFRNSGQFHSCVFRRF